MARVTFAVTIGDKALEAVKTLVAKEIEQITKHGESEKQRNLLIEVHEALDNADPVNCVTKGGRHSGIITR